MRLKNCAFATEVYFPNGGGSTGKFCREPQYKLDLEGSFILIRSASVREGDVTKVPITNVSSFQEHVEPKVETKSNGPTAKA